MMMRASRLAAARPVMGAHWLATRDGAVSPGQPVAKHEAQDRDREKKIKSPIFQRAVWWGKRSRCVTCCQDPKKIL